ncbi:hypothetical protein K438DRAFT_1776485 [Mycena galopus ATCC 62051]|nr:hypothetical protein K438DRAFT_1776485 [Mycena galopus ATCC 62051]
MRSFPVVVRTDSMECFSANTVTGIVYGHCSLTKNVRVAKTDSSPFRQSRPPKYPAWLLSRAMNLSRQRPSLRGPAQGVGVLLIQPQVPSKTGGSARARVLTGIVVDVGARVGSILYSFFEPELKSLGTILWRELKSSGQVGWAILHTSGCPQVHSAVIEG